MWTEIEPATLEGDDVSTFWAAATINKCYQKVSIYFKQKRETRFLHYISLYFQFLLNEKLFMTESCINILICWWILLWLRSFLWSSGLRGRLKERMFQKTELSFQSCSCVGKVKPKTKARLSRHMTKNPGCRNMVICFVFGSRQQLKRLKHFVTWYFVWYDFRSTHSVGPAVKWCSSFTGWATRGWRHAPAQTSGHTLSVFWTLFDFYWQW